MTKFSNILKPTPSPFSRTGCGERTENRPVELRTVRVLMSTGTLSMLTAHVIKEGGFVHSVKAPYLFPQITLPYSPDDPLCFPRLPPLFPQWHSQFAQTTLSVPPTDPSLILQLTPLFSGWPLCFSSWSLCFPQLTSSVPPDDPFLFPQMTRKLIMSQNGAPVRIPILARTSFLPRKLGYDASCLTFHNIFRLFKCFLLRSRSRKLG